jgi:hypothetical protein
MNVTLSNDDYRKLAQLARERGELTEQTAAHLIIQAIR